MSSTATLKLANAAIALALVVVLLGGWTRLNDAGLSCPDWPGCYGAMVLPSAPEAQWALQQRYPEQPLDAGRGWIEMSHRYLAGTLGLLVLGLALQGWHCRRQDRYPLVLSLLLLGLVGVQALFGMWTVTLKLLPQVVTLHLLGGVLTLTLLLRLRQRLGAWRRGLPTQPLRIRHWVGGGVLLLLLQIALGGWTSANYAGWSCSHWWRCEPGQAVVLDFAQAFQLPAVSGQSYLGGHLQREARAAIQMSHRAVGLLLASYLLGLAVVLIRRPEARVAAVLLVIALGLQLLLGVLNVVLGLPLLLAMAHHAGALLLLVTLLWCYERCGFRREVRHG